MNKEQIIELRLKIENSLKELVDRDYVFLDLPYHPNVGDTLIAMAAMHFLKSTGYNCLYYSSEYTFDDRQISSDVLIIFNGGGNFGDLWRNYAVFRNRIIHKYPNNHFLILPQSVSYGDRYYLDEDIKVYSNCGNRITICARDADSYKFLKNHFNSNRILLVPDMAFYTDNKFLTFSTASERILFLRRSDSEFVSSPKYDIVPTNAEVHDWPTLENLSWLHKIYYRIKIRTLKHWYPRILLKMEDYVWQKWILPYNLRSGIRFVNRYDVIYTTRLHVAILAILLNKQVFFFDNSYGKNSALYNTWLTDFSNVTLL